MPERIPLNDPDLQPDDASRNSRRDEWEFELLEAEAALRRLARREIVQRYVIKWVAVITGVVVIVGMAGILWHLVHAVFWGPFIFTGPAFSVAMIVTPILSITTITVTLFVGAFRKFEEKDLEIASNGIAGVASIARGG